MYALTLIAKHFLHKLVQQMTCVQKESFSHFQAKFAKDYVQQMYIYFYLKKIFSSIMHEIHEHTSLLLE